MLRELHADNKIFVESLRVAHVVVASKAMTMQPPA
jgi:hypothetical protein